FYLLPLTAVIGTIGSSSRGAMLGLGVVAMFMFMKSEHKLKGALGMAVLGILSLVLLPEESLDRFRSMGDDGTSVSRITYWTLGLQLMNQFPVLGIGYANWLPYTRSIGRVV